MGAVIGHEMTHGFDDQGRQFDAAGNLRDWWSKESADEYDKRRKAIVQQYAEYEPLPGLAHQWRADPGRKHRRHRRGEDSPSRRCKKRSRRNPEEQSKKIDGFTPEQRFLPSAARRSGGRTFATKT